MSKTPHSILILGLILGLSFSGCSSSSEDATVFEIKFENISGTPSFSAANGSPVVSGFSSLLGAVHEDGELLFSLNTPDRGQGLGNLAENGDPGPLTQNLRLSSDVEIIGIANEPASGSRGVLTPGDSFSLILSTINPSANLSIASSFIQANDIIVATRPNGIPLFSADGTPLSGNITAFFDFYDVGTEVNQAPGIGSDQVIRQGPTPANQTSLGARENGLVRKVNDGFSYPSITQSIRVTIGIIEVGNIAPVATATPSPAPTTTPSPSSTPTATPSPSSTPVASATPTVTPSASPVPTMDLGNIN